MGLRRIRGFLTSLLLCPLVSLVQAWSTRRALYSSRRRHHDPHLLLDRSRSSSSPGSRRPIRPAAICRQLFILNSSPDDISSDGDHIYHNQAQVFLVQTSPSLSEDNAAQHDSNGTPALKPLQANDDNTETDSDPIIEFLPIDISATTTAGASTSSTTSSSAVDVARRAATETWNWCAHFVARHNLCPWAGASVREPFAIRLYGWVDPQENLLEVVLERVAADFANDLERECIDPNTAIAFVLLLSSSSQSSQQIKSFSRDDNFWYDDFTSFYDFFFELEEQWPMQEQVTLAPFHPKWSYFSGGEEEAESLELEKQSPHVTISLVSTATIDKAGEAATEQIAANNQKVLQQKSATEWRFIYENAVHSAKSISDDDDAGSFQ